MYYLEYFIKKIPNLQAILAKISIFCFYGFILLFIRHSFSFELFLNPFFLLICFFSVLQKVLKVLGVKNSKSFITVILIGFAKPFIGYLLSYLLLSNENITLYKVLGGIIIGIGTLFFIKTNRKKND